jgi:hypothetical protein
MIEKILLLWMLVLPVAPADAQVSIGIGLPHVSIGINLPLYPDLEPIPGYPVYYAPRLDANYFFYDGMYWVYRDDNWYASSWYNGPWGLIGPEEVPLFILRVPVRYYRQPPMYFRGWYADSPPRWGDHWGNDWSQRRGGWDKWNRNSAPRPAPLPVYQRQYSGDRYPAADQQRELRSKNYRYEPRDDAVRQHYQAPRVESAPKPQERLQAAPRPESAPQARPVAPERQQREDVQQRKPQEREKAQPQLQAAPRQQQQREEVQRQPQQRESAQPKPQEVQRQPQQLEKAQPEPKERGRDKERDSDRDNGGDRNQGRGR